MFFLLIPLVLELFSKFYCEGMYNQIYTFTERPQRQWKEALRWRGMKQMSPNVMAIFDEGSLPFYVGEPELPEHFSELSQKVKEYVLQSIVMRRYGGMWVDSDLFPIDAFYLVSLMNVVNTPNLDCFWLIESGSDENSPLYSIIVSQRNSTLMRMIEQEQKKNPFVMTKKKLMSFVKRMDDSKKVIVKEAHQSFMTIYTDCSNDKLTLNNFYSSIENKDKEFMAHIVCGRKQTFPYVLWIIFMSVLFLIIYHFGGFGKSEYSKTF